MKITNEFGDLIIEKLALYRHIQNIERILHDVVGVENIDSADHEQALYIQRSADHEKE